MRDKALYWFTRDLRVDDNALLRAANAAQSLLCVAVVDPVWFQQRLWQRPSMSEARWQFLRECLSDLDQALQSRGQTLHILYGSTRQTLSALIAQQGIDRLLVTRQAGTYEQKILKQIQQDLPDLDIQQCEQYTLFTQSQFPFSLDQVPSTFSQFRKLVETLPVAEPTLSIDTLSPMPTVNLKQQIPDWLPPVGLHKKAFKGGEQQALLHLQTYFGGEAPSHYKRVRNELSGWENSSKLSVWLNHGCISPRQVKSALTRYEASNGANESTNWLYVELLWREYFQWLHYRTGQKLFAFGGEQDKPPLTTFYPERFRKWCEGETPYSLVNACMKELNATGYLSNRGRQIAASCLVNELGVDWRYGAAWFEHALLDYDVAVNWGNWQYIAGVGADPRGGRHFNLEKQVQQYDPDGLYQKRWKAKAEPFLDSRDAADWPILPS